MTLNSTGIKRTAVGGSWLFLFFYFLFRGEHSHMFSIAAGLVWSISLIKTFVYSKSRGAAGAAVAHRRPRLYSPLFPTR